MAKLPNSVKGYNLVQLLQKFTKSQQDQFICILCLSCMTEIKIPEAVLQIFWSHGSLTIQNAKTGKLHLLCTGFAQNVNRSSTL